MKNVKTSNTAWLIWAIAAIFYAYQYIIRVMPNVLISDISGQFGMDPITIGQFSGVYYIGYALMHLPVGIMLDRVGPRKVMSGCILLTALGLVPLLFTGGVAYPIIGRFLMGVGSSAAILGLFKIIRMSFSEERFPRMVSFAATIGLMGAIYGGGPLNIMREVLGYNLVVELLIAAGCVLALITYCIVPEATTKIDTKISDDVKEVFTQPRLIFACLFAGLMVGPLEGFADTWGNTFLKEVYGLEGTIAASLPSMMFVGMCFGGPLISLLSERLSNALATIIVAGSVMLLSFTLLLFWQTGPFALSINFALVGVGSGYQILAIYKASTYVRPHVAGLATTAANMIIMIFGYAFHTLIGFIVNMAGGSSDPTAITYGVAVIPLGLVIGIAGFSFLLVKEKIEKGVVVQQEV